MTEFETVIGLELHAHLKTASKLFCSCPTTFGAEPNTLICEGCAGLPGALPRLNEKAVELAVLAGLALGAEISPVSIFARKSYFYPDLPGGYQTSQLDPPICLGGGLAVPGADGRDRFIRLNRIHLEDDAGKCIHEADGRTLVDLNRAGSPLIEIVTEPDLRGSEEAAEFMRRLHGILVSLGVSGGRMEEGEFRCDVNISLRPYGGSEFGVRCEIKNLNSFRHVAQAAEYEAFRQADLIRRGRKVERETRLFDPVRQETRALRSKEEADDYRYFPQPDLPPVRVSEELLERLRASLPELPEAALRRLTEIRGLSGEQAAVIVDRRAVNYFDRAVRTGAPARRLATLMVELFLPACQTAGLSPEAAGMAPENLAALAGLIEDGSLSRRSAYELFPELFEKGGSPADLVRERGLGQISDAGTLVVLAADIVAAHPREAEEFRAGKEKVLSFFVGKLLKATKGQANPQMAQRILLDALRKETPKDE